MTTLAELKTQVAALVADPAMTTFSTNDLGYFINAGIAEVSRIAPQRFVEDIPLVNGQLSYRVRGGTGNLLANPSFEEGDDSIFVESPVSVTTTTDDGLLAGWSVTSTTAMWFSRNSLSKHGLHSCVIQVPVAGNSYSIYQNVPVNPSTTYLFSGWHWKSAAGGSANSLRMHTLDVNGAQVDADVVRHDTTAATPVYMSGSYTTPDDGTVAFLQVQCLANALNSPTIQKYLWDAVSLVEAGDANLVADNSVGDIELRRVEVWTVDDGTTPAHGIMRAAPGAAEYENYSEAGWDFWDGVLSLPYRIYAKLNTATNYLRVWGYAPYDKLTAASQATDLSNELEQAVITYCKVAALERLVYERDLFTQWQTRAGVSDVSPASLMSSLNLARDDWRRTKRALTVLREAP